jgi:hypothetical protein
MCINAYQKKGSLSDGALIVPVTFRLHHQYGTVPRHALTIGLVAFQSPDDRRLGTGTSEEKKTHQYYD